MSIQKLADNLYIAPQLTEADVQEAAKLGIQTVICNRPDGEEENQVTFKQIESWLEAAGIREHHHQPVVAPAINAADVAAFQNLLKAFPNPSSPTAAPAPAAPCSGAIIRCKTVQASPKSSLPHNKQASI